MTKRSLAWAYSYAEPFFEANVTYTTLRAFQNRFALTENIMFQLYCEKNHVGGIPTAARLLASKLSAGAFMRTRSQGTYIVLVKLVTWEDT